MAKRTSGRKKAFEPELEPERIHIILPKKTRIALEVYAVRNELSRNEVINTAVLNLVGKDGEESKEKVE